jgi:salicylate hydroxylase
MGTPRIAVVGAGVAGLAIATLLRRRGVRCDLYEQTPALAAVGAGIQLGPNGVRILRRLGIGPALADRGVAARAIEVRRWDDGARLARVPHGADCEAAYGAPYYLIHRADLQRALVDALPGGGLGLGRRVVGVTDRTDHAELALADGSRVRADAVVGADGVHSVVREAVLADERRFAGCAVYRGLVPADVVPSFVDDPRVLFWLGPGRHVTYYPIASRRTVHVSAVFSTDEPEDRPADRAELAAAFAGWHADVREVLAAPPSVTRWGLFDRDFPDRYRSGRLALVGDAAHPMLPYLSQGASQALEDAVTLADCVTGAEDVDAALSRYERARRPRTAEVHRRSREQGRVFHLPDGPDQAERDAGLAGQTLDDLRWLYGAETALSAAA